MQGSKNSSVGQYDQITNGTKRSASQILPGDRRDFAAGSLWFAGREIIVVNSTLCLAKETPISYSKSNCVRDKL